MEGSHPGPWVYGLEWSGWRRIWMARMRVWRRVYVGVGWRSGSMLGLVGGLGSPSCPVLGQGSSLGSPSCPVLGQGSSEFPILPRGAIEIPLLRSLIGCISTFGEFVVLFRGPASFVLLFFEHRNKKMFEE